MAHEYGGGPRAILDGVYLDELFFMVKKINRRRAVEYLTQARIVSFPHMDKAGREAFIREIKEMAGGSHKPKKLDETGFAALKFAMSQNPRIIVK